MTSTDPRLPVAVAALERLYDSSADPSVTSEEIAGAILAALPAPKPGDLAVMTVPELPETDDDRASYDRLSVLLAQAGVMFVVVSGDAELTVQPEPEDLWRAGWASVAAARVAQFAEELEEESARHRNAYERNAWAGAAERLREAAPRLLTDTTERV